MTSYSVTIKMVLFFFVTLVGALSCRPEGPILPAGMRVNASHSFLSARASLDEALEHAILKEIAPGWAVGNTSFSLAVVSTSQVDPGKPIWEFHHRAKENTKGTNSVDRDSQYLIGSVTKVLADLALIRSELKLDKPITAYLPELQCMSNSSGITWNDITLRMLASHMAGIPSDYGFSEKYYLKDLFLSHGFPAVDDSAYPPCGVLALNGPCTKQQILSGLGKGYPVALPMESPAYSNVAFTLIGLAMESVTGKNFSDIIADLVAEPLGLSNTLTSPGSDDVAVIPPVENSWGADYGLNAPAGGLVSSLSDMSRLCYAILTRSPVLGMKPTEIRQWLKPVAFAGSASSSTGMPWEIFRSSKLTPEYPHPVTVYGKSGGAFGYRSQISVVDEYGVAFVVLTAGDMKAAPQLTNALLGSFLPAIDKYTREEASQQYARTFKANGANEADLEVHLELDNESLKISSMTRNDSDILRGLVEIWSSTIGGYGNEVGSIVRLFPTEIANEVELSGVTVTREVWRLWPGMRPVERADLPGHGLFENDCMAWTVGNWVHYGGEPLDRVLFYRGQGGHIVGFEVPFLRSGVLEPV